MPFVQQRAERWQALRSKWATNHPDGLANDDGSASVARSVVGRDLAMTEAHRHPAEQPGERQATRGLHLADLIPPELTQRLIDLDSPIGKRQRGLIV